MAAFVDKNTLLTFFGLGDCCNAGDLEIYHLWNEFPNYFPSPCSEMGMGPGGSPMIENSQKTSPGKLWRSKLNIPQLYNSMCILWQPRMHHLRFTEDAGRHKIHRFYSQWSGASRQSMGFRVLIPVPYMQYLQHSPAQTEQIWYDPIINQDI